MRVVDWRPAVDPQIEQRLEAGGRVLGDLTVADLPALYDERRDTPEVPCPPGVGRVDVEIGGLNLRVHAPKDRSGPSGCVFWIHGGGFIVGSNRMDDQELGAWVLAHRCVTVAVDYRLAPEAPYPAAIDDCETGLRWTLEHAADLDVDPARLGVAGRSAGGGLAVALALRMRSLDPTAVSFILLDSPSLDDRQITASSQWDVPIAGPSTVRLGWQAYLGQRFGTEDVPADAAPARGSDIRGLPQAFISVGAVDGLHDEAVDFAGRLHRAGVPTELRVYPGAVHNFARIAPDSDVARQLRRDQNTWLHTRLKRAV